MRIFKLEHSRLLYGADLAFYGLAVLGLSGFLAARLEPQQRAQGLALVGLGVLMWTMLEYLLHRFLLHRVEPFRRWHLSHHQRPQALICTPTPVSALAFATLVFAPALWLFPRAQALPTCLGILLGAFVYSMVHHAMHHGPARGPWLRQRMRWHALHHRAGELACYGVTTSLWDRLMGTVAQQRI
jgi:cyclopropane-fatty-acyl-phospholipid synthase